jgi:parallel beta-helix repeat protein
VDAIGNTFSGNRGSGMFYDAMSKGTIRGNTCDDNAVHGIDTCGRGTVPIITGNRCRNNGEVGIVH